MYLPEKKVPPDLVIMPPRGCATVAMLPEPVAPAVAFSVTNSLALIGDPKQFIVYNACWALLHTHISHG